MREEVNGLMMELQEAASKKDLTEADILNRLTFYQVKRSVGAPISEKHYKQMKKALAYSKDHFVCGYVDVPFYKSVLWKGFTTYDEENVHVIETKGTIYLSFLPSTLSDSVASIVHFLIDQRIPSLGKIALTHQNISLMLSFEDGADAITVRNFVWEHLKGALAPHDPFIPDYGGVGLITGEEIPYQALLSEYLTTYLTACKNADRLTYFTFDRFYKTLKQSYERNGSDEPYLVHRVLMTLEHLH